MKTIFFLFMILMLNQFAIAKSGPCKAHMRDKNDNVIDTFATWAPYYNRGCELALVDCNNFLDDRIRNGETELNKGQCTAEWENPLPSRPTQRMAKNYCSVFLKNIKTGTVVGKPFIDMYRGTPGFSSWMTACNKAMTTCMLARPIINGHDFDCVREEFED